MTTVPSERHASVTIDGKEKCSSDKRTEEDNGVITGSSVSQFMVILLHGCIYLSVAKDGNGSRRDKSLILSIVIH